MSTKHLFDGVAVVIDDQIGDKKANINDLISQIESRNMPVVSYTSLPDDKVLSHLDAISFFILDWKLLSAELSDAIQEGVKTPAVLGASAIQDNIDFIKKLRDTVFAPIFIFTNENVKTIIQKLEENDLYHEKLPNCIFVKKKDDLKRKGKLFQEIESWAKKIPAIYVLKEWDREYRKAKNTLFSEFYKLNPSWPRILWESFKSDNVDMSFELGDAITRNIYTRMTPFTFDENIIESVGKKIPKNEIRKVLEGDRFIRNEQLNKNDIASGDVFVESYQENGITRQRYFLNIRAQCDLIHKSNKDNIELYCLKGTVLDESKINKKDGFPFLDGHFIEKINHAIILCIDGGKCVLFTFRDIKIKKWKELKDKRIGRLLPPYITHIQQRYSLYFHRVGLPRTPKEVF